MYCKESQVCISLKYLDRLTCDYNIRYLKDIHVSFFLFLFFFFCLFLVKYIFGFVLMCTTLQWLTAKIQIPNQPWECTVLLLKTSSGTFCGQ